MSTLKAGTGEASSESKRPYSEIENYVLQLENQTAELTNVLMNLRGRLELVLQSDAPTLAAGKLCEAKQAPLSPLGKKLNDVLSANSATISEFEDLINRLHC